MINIKTLEDINIKYSSDKAFNKIVLGKEMYDNLMDSIAETNEKVFPSYIITFSHMIPNYIVLLMNGHEVVDVINLNQQENE